MTPTISLAKLSGLRGRERAFQVIWGITRWLAFALTLFAVAVITDWVIDRFRDTPMYVRMPLMFLQLVALSVAGLFWIVLPWAKGPSLVRLARRVEERIPEFDHRLVTAIQLNHQDAQTAGMSPQLIRIVTEEAESIAGKHDMKSLADSRRLKWSLGLIAWPLLVVVCLLVYFGPATLSVLAQRQLLSDLPIPRDITLVTTTKKNPWPAGDEVIVRYDVTSQAGRLTKEMKGTVVYQSSENDHRDECELVWDDQTEFSPNRASFKAKVPHSSRNFSYRARLADGRSSKSDEVVFEARPQITIDAVWIQAPAYVPGRPESQTSNKNIKAFDGSQAHVRIFSQKPLAEATLMLCQLDAKGEEFVAESHPMKLLDEEIVASDGRNETRHPAESSPFSLVLERGLSKWSSYKVSVIDQSGFTSADNPRGSIEVQQPEIPVVKLIPENETIRGNPKLEDEIFEGMPVPIGGKFRVEYRARSDIGICTPYRRAAEENRLINPARLVYMINDLPTMHYLVLTEVPATEQTGEFNFDTISFANLVYQSRTLNNQVPFTASADRLQGGGFFEIDTNKITKKREDGTEGPLELNDRISYFVEVFDCDPSPGREPGRSDIRQKIIKTELEVAEAARRLEAESERIKEITKRQQEVSKRAREK